MAIPRSAVFTPFGGYVMAVRETRATIVSPATTFRRALVGVVVRNASAVAAHRFRHPRPGHPFGHRPEDHRYEDTQRS